MKALKNRNMLITSMLLGLLFLLTSILSLGNISLTAYAAGDDIRDGYNVEDIRGLLGEDSDFTDLELFNEDGTMEKIQVPSNANDEQESRSGSQTRAIFTEQKIVDSGKLDSQSIVITIMGDGFDDTEQNDFIAAAKDAMDFMLGNPTNGIVGFYPFNLFKDVFTVYAIEVISPESGVSRDADTNNGNIVDNYFGSSFYYGNNTSDIERALVITKKSRARALKKPRTSMTAILCNSERWGGTGGEFAVASLHSGNKRILTHEFGHSFGGLADEYYELSDGSFKGKEAPNMTKNNNPVTVKWSQWLGYKNVGIYPYSDGVDANDPKFDPKSHNWFRPHQSCHMRSSQSYDFCPVCSAELIGKIEAKAGSFFDTTNLSGSDIRIDNVNYTIRDKFEIPPVYNNKRVTEIYNFAFANQNSCDEFVIPSSITSIGLGAFFGHSGLTKVTFQAGSQLTSIGSWAFYNCKKLTSITVPNSVISIGSGAFLGCSDLTSITLPFAGNSRTATGTAAYFNYVFDTIPTSLKMVTIADSESINPNAFSGCSGLTNINLLSGLASIGLNAFRNCSSLQNINLPASLEGICNSAFRDCSSLTSITLPESLISIGNRAFYGCGSLDTITLQGNITSIGSEAFYGCAVTGVGIGSGVYYIDDVFLNFTTLINIHAGGNTTYYSDNGVLYRHYKYSNALVRYPQGKTDVEYEILNMVGIEDNAFRNAKLQRIIMPDGVYQIGAYAFYNCPNLSYVKLSAGLTAIGGYAFLSCPNLTEITIADFNPSQITLGMSAFNSALRIYVRGDYLSEVKSSWPKYYYYINPIPVKVTYDLQGGNPLGSDHKMIGVYNEAYTLDIPEKAGYTFEGWYSGTGGTGDKYTYFNGKGVNNFTDIEDLNLYAYWSTRPILLLQTSGGGITQGEGVYNANSTAQATAIPNAGYSFDGWYNGNNLLSTNVTYFFTMPANNLTLEARFSINTYTLTVTPSMGGDVSSGGGQYVYDTAVLLEATPDTGYFFLGWYENNVLVYAHPSYNFSIPAYNLTLEARFWTEGYDSGYGTESEPFVITDKEHLIYLKNQVNNGEDYSLDKYFELGAHINLEGMEWTPIGYIAGEYYTWNGYDFTKVFRGNFDGKGFIISDFKITLNNHTDPYNGTLYVGVFGYAYNVEIQNLGIENFYIDVAQEDFIYAGGLVGYNSGGDISKCYTKGGVFAFPIEMNNPYAWIGGLIGYNEDNAVSGCYATGNVYCFTSSGYSEVYVGGLIGQSENGTIEFCYAEGNVYAEAKYCAYAGGLLGYGYGCTISNSYAIGDVDAKTTGTNSTASAGGLAGYCSDIINCYAIGSVTAVSTIGGYSTACAGGLTGVSDGSISNSFAAGDVSAYAANGYAYAGGLLGDEYGTVAIADCYRYLGQSVLSSGNYNYSGAVCSLVQLNSQNFYTADLGWSASVWDFSNLDFLNGDLPKLIW